MPDASPSVRSHVAGRAGPAAAAVRSFSDRRYVALGGGVEAMIRDSPLRRHDLDASLRRPGLAISPQPLPASTGRGGGGGGGNSHPPPPPPPPHSVGAPRLVGVAPPPPPPPRRGGGGGGGGEVKNPATYPRKPAGWSVFTKWCIR